MGLLVPKGAWEVVQIPYIRRVIRSGDVLEIEEYYTDERGPNYKGSYAPPDKEKKAEYIHRGRVRQLSRLINANFKEGDLFVTLTFRKSVSLAQCRTDMINYLRRLKSRRTKLGLEPLKYIYVTERGVLGRNKHHHLLLNDMPTDDVIELWKQGRVLISRLSPYADYTGIANYITKEDRPRNEKGWRRSHNLIVPRPQTVYLQPYADNIRLPAECRGFHIVANENYYGKGAGMRKYLRAVAPGGHDWGVGDELLL